jgi:hypothetical protein
MGFVPPHTQKVQGEIFNTPPFYGGDSLFTNTRLKNSLVRPLFDIISPLLNRRNFMG